MPAYAWLSRTGLRIDDLQLHLQRLRTLGVPYTDAMVANAVADAAGQAAPNSDGGWAVSERYGEATNVRDFDGEPGAPSEMDALVAYLQMLGRQTNIAHTPAAEERQ